MNLLFQKGVSNQSTFFVEMGDESEPSIFYEPHLKDWWITSQNDVWFHPKYFQCYLKLPHILTQLTWWTSYSTYRWPLYEKIYNYNFFLWSIWNFFFCLQSTSSFNDTSSNSPFLKVLFTASSRVIILAYSFAFKPTMFTRIFFFFSFKSPKDTLFHYFNFDLKAYNFFINLWPSHSFRSTLIPPTIKIFLKIWVRQPQI